MKDILVIVPCGKQKIWDKDPWREPVIAAEAYTGPPFKVNKEYAEHFAERWVILSAKYGFVAPDFAIPGPYDVTFNKKATEPISVAKLREQAHSMGLLGFGTVVGLGGKEYRAVLEDVFASRVQFPFQRGRQGEKMKAVKQAIESGHPLPEL